MDVYMIDLWSVISKPVLKLVFKAHGKNGIFLRIWTLQAWVLRSGEMISSE
jgi:hypothetical protein